jgi:hypothetical protein
MHFASAGREGCGSIGIGAQRRPVLDKGRRRLVKFEQQIGTVAPPASPTHNGAVKRVFYNSLLSDCFGIASFAEFYI